MDMQALKTDVKLALHTLPKELVDVATKVLDEHRATLEKSFPLILEYLKPHAVTAMMETGMGMLDKGELESTLTAALAEVIKERATHDAHGG